MGVNLFGTDLTGAFDAIKGATSDLLGNLDLGGARQPAARQLQGPTRDPFAGLAGGGNNAFDRLGAGGRDPFGDLGTSGNPFAGLGRQGDMLGFSPLFSAFNAATQKVQQKAAQAAQGQPQTTGSTVGSGPSSGMEAGVAQWAQQAQQTFGDINGLDPDTMLAIMTNESHGNPNAYNSAGNAYGLFQQVGFGDGDPNWGANVNGQFQAAHQLALEKMAGINAAYAKNGINPDARTRALDFAAAWAGHFDYNAGRLDPNSVDRLVGGQTSQQFAQIFLSNYDKIKAGRQQASAPAGGVRVSAQGFAFPVVGWDQPVQLHWGSEQGGTDIMAAAGTPIVSMGAGTITDVSPNSLGGNTVTMKLDNGLIVYMAHMRDAPLVAAGQRVAAGTPLGFVGTTGNAAGGPAHLHIGIGYGIQAGSGPTGGLGTGFNAVDWLNQILQQTGPPTGGGGAANR